MDEDDGNNSTIEESSGAQYEQSHVHEVYEQIAPHFSSTRYKPWPFITQFLNGLPSGSVGLDVGAGNGKYLNINPALYIVASDRSPSLIQIASLPLSPAKDTIVADMLNLPHPASRFDFAISIAAVHHLSTEERRVDGVRAILNLLRKSEPQDGIDAGVALIYVWALEQKNSRRGWDEGDNQDVMVPWVTRPKQNKTQEGDEASGTGLDKDQTFLRYYHLYRQGELEENVRAAGGRVVDSGYEKDNWWVIASPPE